MLLNKKTEKFIRSVEEKEKKRLKLKLQSLSENPIPGEAKKIEGKYRNLFRIRVGNLRILYFIDYKNQEIIVVKIDRRSKVYR